MNTPQGDDRDVDSDYDDIDDMPHDKRRQLFQNNHVVRPWGVGKVAPDKVAPDKVAPDKVAPGTKIDVSAKAVSEADAQKVAPERPGDQGAEINQFANTAAVPGMAGRDTRQKRQCEFHVGSHVLHR
jgi:hypothetical protein